MEVFFAITMKNVELIMDSSSNVLELLCGLSLQMGHIYEDDPDPYPNLIIPEYEVK